MKNPLNMKNKLNMNMPNMKMNLNIKNTLSMKNISMKNMGLTRMVIVDDVKALMRGNKNKDTDNKKSRQKDSELDETDTDTEMDIIIDHPGRGRYDNSNSDSDSDSESTSTLSSTASEPEAEAEVELETEKTDTNIDNHDSDHEPEMTDESEEEQTQEQTQEHKIPPNKKALTRIHNNKRDRNMIVNNNNTIQNIDTHAITEMEQALDIQRKKHGNLHPCITASLHALALEYKTIRKYDTAILYIRDAVGVVDDRIDAVFVELLNDEDVDMDVIDEGSMDDVRMDLDAKMHGRGQDDGHADAEHSEHQSPSPSPSPSPPSSPPRRATGRSRKGDEESKYTQILTNAQVPSATKRYTVHLLTEKSVLYSTLANVYNVRKMYKEAMEYYVRSVNMLVEAGYDGDSKRVAMMLRIMKRLETNRRVDMMD